MDEMSRSRKKICLQSREQVDETVLGVRSLKFSFSGGSPQTQGLLGT